MNDKCIKFGRLVNGGVEVKSLHTGETYQITRSSYTSKRWRCTCPDSRFRGGECKHIKSFLAGEIDLEAVGDDWEQSN